MVMTKVEMVTLKMNLLGGMNSYIEEIGDEDVTARWLEIMPDEATEDDLRSIAEDEELWKIACSTFGRITSTYREGA